MPPLYSRKTPELPELQVGHGLQTVSGTKQARAATVSPTPLHAHKKLSVVHENPSLHTPPRSLSTSLPALSRAATLPRPAPGANTTVVDRFAAWPARSGAGLDNPPAGNKPALVHEIERYIERELQTIDTQGPSSERLEVFKRALTMFGDHFKCYAGLFDLILREFDSHNLHLQRQGGHTGVLQSQFADHLLREFDQRKAFLELRHAQREHALQQELAELRSQLNDMQVHQAAIEMENQKLRDTLREDHERNVLLSGSIIEYRFQHQKVRATAN